MRRRSRVRPTLAAACAALLVTAACAGDDPVIDLDDAPDDLVEEPADEPDLDDGVEADDLDGAGADAAPEQDDQDVGPAPDAALAADPCGPHQGREGEAFIAVVSPVDDQDVGDGSQVELVGCSNVFEANVVWELVAADETVLDEGFTTAECGNGCVGAFRETLDLSAGADHEDVALHVIGPDVSDGEGEEIREVVPLVYG